MNYKLKFENNLKLCMHNMFVKYGFKVPIKANIDEMLLDYLTIVKKMVHLKPRIVQHSPILKSTLNQNVNYTNTVNVITKLLSEGKDVNKFQSKKLFQTRFHDHLLYEWNIYHFHLSTKIDKRHRFVKQTDALLFAYIDDFNAILLDIQNHNTGIFADQRWLEILDIHYPHILEPYIAKDLIDISPNLESEARQDLWNKGYSIGMTKVNDKIIHSPGIGRTMSGHSSTVVKTSLEVLRWIDFIINIFENHYTLLCMTHGYDEYNSNFILRFGDHSLELFEMHSGRIVLSYPELISLEVA